METKTYKINWFVTYFKHAIEKRTNAKLNCFNYNIALKHLEIFTSGNDVPFNQISTEWFDSLKEYFNEAKGLRCEKLLSKNSANSYFSIITTIAREAANDGFLNPQIVSSIKNLGSRTHALSTALSLEELHRLVNTNCSSIDLKKAFVFSCLTGMQLI